MASLDMSASRSRLAPQAGAAIDCLRPIALKRLAVMPVRPHVLLLAAILPACTAGNPPPTAFPDRDRWTPPERSAENVGNDVLRVVGTPFYALVKGVGCVASVVVATPVAIGLGLSRREDRALIRSELDKGVGANCGGSYALGDW